MNHRRLFIKTAASRSFTRWTLQLKQRRKFSRIRRETPPQEIHSLFIKLSFKATKNEIKKIEKDPPETKPILAQIKPKNKFTSIEVMQYLWLVFSSAVS